uniref:Uncharacterized protein n=1 Tax=Favella ehrenbergii TaxID=182087 RepID=A0A7S3I3Z0_9SPIT|mmetsp:Transcript_40269/g.52744  ORF Transcript_40269/g.52744 Transcript_40269/m.52744 type:complete len:115 (+) Transcript_40269:801-1145(+)
MWRAEQARTSSSNLRAKLKNKISALRSRMKQKINKDERKNQNLASYQSNFRMFIKSLLEIDQIPDVQLYMRLFTDLGLKYDSYFVDEEPSRHLAALKHVLINALERFVWIDEDE